MAKIVQTTDLHTAGNAITLAQGDYLTVLEGVQVSSQDSHGVLSNYGVTVQVDGSVHGGIFGLLIGRGPEASDLTVGREGRITGGPNYVGAFVRGLHSVVNNGEISAIGAFSEGLLTFGNSGSVWNAGSISGGTAIERNGGSATNTSVTTFNSGTLTGSRSYFSHTLDYDRVTNIGLMVGEVLLGGRVTNNFDSHEGRVYGAIQGHDGGADTVYGGTNSGQNIRTFGGDDVLGGSGGADRLDGGTGADTASYRYSSRAMIIDLAVQAADDGDVLVSIEKVIGSDFNDTVFGSQNGDVMEGGLGADRLNGYGGVDTVSYAGSNRGMIVDLTTRSASDGDTFISVENVLGSAFADTVLGSNDRNRLEGGGGDDHLSGFGGVDVLLGGAGDDVLNGGPGRNRLDGGAGSDTISLEGAPTGVIVDLAAQATSQGDSLVSIENVIGSAFNDTVFGSSGNNLMEGGGGADKLYGYNGVDTVSYANATRGMVVSLAARTADDGDTFIAVEGVIGSAFDDSIIGSAESNTLIGGGGADTLTGGGNPDRFEYHALSDSAPGAADRITDAGGRSLDVVDLTRIDANTLLADDQAVVLVSAFSFTAGEGVLAYDAGTNTTTLTLDVDGDAAADFELMLTGDVTAFSFAL